MATEMIRLHIEETGEDVLCPRGVRLDSLAKDYAAYHTSRIMAARVNNDIRELFKTLKHDATIRFIDMSVEDGARIYQRGLVFILYAAARDLFPDRRLRVLHSLGQGLFCDFRETRVTDDEIAQIKQRMHELIDQDVEYQKKELYKWDALQLLENLGMHDKAELLRYRSKSTVNIYYLGKHPNYFYGFMPHSTGDTPLFDLIPYRTGMVLVFPGITSPTALPDYVPQAKLADIFDEAEEWGRIIGVETAGDLNSVVASGRTRELIMVSEMLHEKKIAQLADRVTASGAHLVLIAGPSSSGKTTFSKRLALQLRVNGFDPHAISLDDYFVDRDKNPLDPEGKPDFECLESLNTVRFNNDLNRILAGETVTRPKYSFKTGTSTETGDTIVPNNRTILVVEGIHGLNPKLTSQIPDSAKYRIYVSALTFLNLDADNRIPTTDVRILRRMVRDHNFRGYSALQTLQIWHSVRMGEERHIFPFQENADAMFNSSLVYELAFLKNYAMQLLLQIDNTVPEYSEARRLIRFLDYFLPVMDIDVIPSTSIIREFIGNSYFNY
ncbi:nucleoside kinase [Candidatus Cryosericum terrychapinii]|uniref:Nucleoside kinase n=1 Tax=Candidatus Cryosericum terrychapinii TaxID=2290919 RepID=A0A398CT71_9BACT|nr:nucleoside kinase [Candidatus Cryosericum terrychapinii]RIE05815.1 nucleoside kinase [Candidatus Cryosericum terrychapinii]